MNIAVIGDIHGNATHLEKALTRLQDEAHRIVCVGDYINGGDESRAVLDLLVDASKILGKRLHLLRGNHDQALLDFLLDGEVSGFIHHGGLSTIRSYVKPNESAPLEAFRETFPDNHLELLRNTFMFVEEAETLISHCGFNPRHPNRRQLGDVVTGRFPELFEKDVQTPRPLVVFGHYAQLSKVPYVTNSVICIDTGCGTYPEAPLSAVLLPSRDVIQFT